MSIAATHMNWSLKHGDRVIFTMARGPVVRDEPAPGF